MIKRTVGLFVLAVTLAGAVGAPQSVPYRAEPRLPDVAEELSPADVQLEGWLGARVLNSERSRLATVDLQPFLAGFQQKPGSHPWIGEHIGKWMHAATLAWV